MCHKYPTARLARLAAGAAFALSVLAQTAPQPPTEWRKVGGASAELLLASPATGPVDNVWFWATAPSCSPAQDPARSSRPPIPSTGWRRPMPRRRLPPWRRQPAAFRTPARKSRLSPGLRVASTRSAGTSTAPRTTGAHGPISPLIRANPLSAPASTRWQSRPAAPTNSWSPTTTAFGNRWTGACPGRA